MRLTEAEIKSIAASTARIRSGGCSRQYNSIRNELEQQLKEDDDEPEPDMSIIPPPFDNPIPEVIFVRKFFAWSFSILFILMTILIVWTSIAEAI